MDYSKHQSWIVNGLLAVVLAALVGWYCALPASPAFAAGGGWETNGVMAMEAPNTERLVLIDTQKKNIMVYRTQGMGTFRLCGARSYQYDLEIPDDTAGNPLENRGATFAEVYNAYRRKP